MFEKKNWLAAFAVSVALIVGLMCAGCKNSVDGDVGVSSRNSGKLTLPQVGDLILKNGSVIPAAEINASHKDEAMAIVYWVDVSNRKFMGMGVEIGTSLYWSNPSTSALKLFDESKQDLSYWKPILSVDPQEVDKHRKIDENMFPYWVQYASDYNAQHDPDIDSFDTEGSYPAFEYANGYGKNNNLDGNWFLPTPLSLVEIGVNREKINNAFKNLTKTPLGGDKGGSGEDVKYWSSISQRGFGNRTRQLALRLNNTQSDTFTAQLRGLNLNVYECPKKAEEKCSVIAVRVFQY